MDARLDLAPQLTLFRGNRARVNLEAVKIADEVGRYGGGVLYQVAMISRGEALGHGFWVDQQMVEAVTELAAAKPSGVKSRFTHPSMSSDGLGRHLGRIFNVDTIGDKAVGDLHFARSAHDTPDGDLADYVMTLATEDPEAAGLSIVFERDLDAELQFLLDHGARLSEETGRLLLDDFESPDALNVDNLPHVRAAELRAADVVDEPAANEDGMFERLSEPREADQFLRYALYLSNEKPPAFLGVDPDRARQFLNRWAQSNDVCFSSSKDEDDMTTEAPPEAPAVDERELRDGFNAELSRFREAFGADNGVKWFTDGKSYEDALQLHCDELTAALEAANARIEELESQVSAVDLGEPEPIDTGAADDANKKVEFKSMFKQAGSAPANN